MGGNRYSIVSDYSVRGHMFRCYDVVDDDSLTDEIAALVADLYVDATELLDSLRTASLDLGQVASESDIDALISEIRDLCIPTMTSTGKQPLHLRTPRNEVAEVLAYDALQRIHGVIIPASRVREKEVSGQPARGIDIFGFLVGPTFRPVIAEVKASSSSASPPSVVDTGDDSLHNQIKTKVADRATLLRELNWSFKHASSEMKKQVASAMLEVSRSDSHPPVAMPVLVRPHDKYADTDFGCFQETPENYTPAEIRFTVLRIQGAIESFADKVYARAREVA